MIIDIHCHLWDQSIIAPNFGGNANLSVELLLDHMNQAKIDKTVILALDSTLSYNFFVPNLMF